MCIKKLPCIYFWSYGKNIPQGILQYCLSYLRKAEWRFPIDKSPPKRVFQGAFIRNFSLLPYCKLYRVLIPDLRPRRPLLAVLSTAPAFFVLEAALRPRVDAGFALTVSAAAGASKLGVPFSISMN